jgi:hypothetical protein
MHRMGLRRPRHQEHEHQEHHRRAVARHFRRTALVGVGVAATLTALATTAAGQTEAPTVGGGGFNKGTGSALADTVRFNPVAGGLSFGIALGESIAGHQNTAATAEARSANLGVIGTTLAGEGCDGGDPTLPAEDQPQALRIDSGEEGAEEGKSGQDPKVPGIDRSVRATTDPYAEALTSGGGRELVPGQIGMGPSSSFASSGIIDGSTREAIGRAEISEITLGPVAINGLRWEAVHRSGSTEEQAGTFTIGGMTIAGTPVPVEDPTEAIAQANAALEPLGFQFRPPRVHTDSTASGTIVVVDPLSIRIIPSPARDGIVNPVLNGAQPAREELFAALIEQDCGNASYITVLDIVLNAFGAGGYFGIEFGGARASTAEINAFTGLGASGGTSAPTGGVLPSSGATGGSSGLPRTGTSTTGGSTTATPGSNAGGGGGTGGGGDGTGETALEPVSDTSGARGGALAGVGGAGLLALLASAEADRRKMRRAQRELPMEA